MGMVTPYAVSRDRPVLSYTWPSHGSLSPSTVEGGPSGPKASIWEQGPGGLEFAGTEAPWGVYARPKFSGARVQREGRRAFQVRLRTQSFDHTAMPEVCLGPGDLVWRFELDLLAFILKPSSRLRRQMKVTQILSQ